MKSPIRKTSKKMLARLPEDAARLISEKNVVVNKNIQSKSSDVKYSKQRALYFYQGYDFLENSIVIRQFIQERYKINICILEMILFLFPKNFFSHVDYKMLPKQFQYRKIDSMIDLGLIKIAVPGDNKGKHIYSLSRQAKEIVKLYYEYLSGEKIIPQIPKDNAFARSNARPIDKKKMELIKLISKQEPSEAKKAMFK